MERPNSSPFAKHDVRTQKLHHTWRRYASCCASNYTSMLDNSAVRGANCSRRIWVLPFGCDGLAHGLEKAPVHPPDCKRFQVSHVASCVATFLSATHLIDLRALKAAQRQWEIHSYNL